MTDEQRDRLADRMVGVAYILEGLAKHFKAGARDLKRHGLPAAIDAKEWTASQEDSINGIAARAIAELRRP